MFYNILSYNILPGDYYKLDNALLYQAQSNPVNPYENGEMLISLEWSSF